MLFCWLILVLFFQHVSMRDSYYYFKMERCTYYFKYTHTFRNRTNTSRVIHFLFEWSLYYQRSTWVFFQQIKRKRASLFLFFHHLIRQRQHIFFYMNGARYCTCNTFLFCVWCFFLLVIPLKKTREFRLLNLKRLKRSVMLSLLDICIDGGGYVIREIGSTIV